VNTEHVLLIINGMHIKQQYILQALDLYRACMIVSVVCYTFIVILLKLSECFRHRITYILVPCDKIYSVNSLSCNSDINDIEFSISN
jgi:hypothetical protein